MSTYTVGKIEVQVSKGDITKTKAKVLVCPIGYTFADGHVSNAVHKAAGSDVRKEFDTLASGKASFEPGTNLCTGAGNLDFRNILYAPSKRKDGRQLTEQLEELNLTIFKTVFYAAKIIHASSMVIPAISGGMAGHTPKDVTSSMIQAIVRFGHRSDIGSLKTIYLVDINDEIVDGWHECLMNLRHAETDIELYNIEVRIHNMNLLDVDADAIVCPKGLTMGSGIAGSVIEKAAGKAFKKEVKEIMRRRNNRPFKPGEIDHTGPGKLKIAAIVLAPSVPRDISRPILDQMDDLKETVKKVLIYSERVLGVESIAMPAVSGGNAGYKPKEVAIAIIESIIEFMKMPNRGSIKRILLVDTNRDIVNQWHTTYDQNIKTRPRRSCSTGRSESSSSYLETISLPPNWSDLTIEDQGVKLEELPVTNSEYIAVEGRFKKEAGRKFCVDKVSRIQNSELHRTFELKHEEMRTRIAPPKTIVKELWHGTAGDPVPEINRNGFNRTYCGKNGTRFGKGVYFACSAKYSTCKEKYTPPDKMGHRYIYLAEVLVGDYCKGKKDLKEPPSKGQTDPTVRYDSVVDDMKNPSMFVVFRDNQVYPKYLVEFHK